MKDCILLYYILIKDDSDRFLLYHIIEEFNVNDNILRHFIPIYEGETDVKCLNNKDCNCIDSCEINLNSIKDNLKNSIEEFRKLRQWI
jgi:hypothetical protein